MADGIISEVGLTVHRAPLLVAASCIERLVDVVRRQREAAPVGGTRRHLWRDNFCQIARRCRQVGKRGPAAAELHFGR
jgi:hypothetical protein